jgi:hypothetical protein
MSEKIILVRKMNKRTAQKEYILPYWYIFSSQIVELVETYITGMKQYRNKSNNFRSIFRFFRREDKKPIFTNLHKSGDSNKNK